MTISLALFIHLKAAKSSRLTQIRGEGFAWGLKGDDECIKRQKLVCGYSRNPYLEG